MPGVLEVRRAVDAGKHDEEKAPAGSRGVDPSCLDGAIERGIRAEVMRCGAKDRATERNAMRTVREAAGDRRTDCDALGDEVEHRGRWCDVAVEQGALNAAVAARRAPLFPPPAGGSGAIQPADAGNAGATGIAAEEEGDVGDARRRRKHGRSHTPPAGLDDRSSKVRELATRQQLPQDVGAGTVDQDKDCTHAVSGYQRPPGGRGPGAGAGAGGRSQHKPKGLQKTIVAMTAVAKAITTTAGQIG